MAEQSDVFVVFGADITPLVNGMNEASNRLGNFGNAAKDVGKDLAKLAAATAVAGAAIVAMASNAARNSRELQNMARLSGVSAQEFTNLAFAANSVGIEQDKLADIFKDTQDKIGDFLQTGGGPLLDFFDNIAPKVGVTIEDFKKLSGPQALGLYTSSLQKANLSQSEMVFFMEAIASDSTALLPLLINNGHEFGVLADQADRFGVALSDVDLRSLDDMQKSLDSTSAVFGAITNDISAKLAPAIEFLNNQLLVTIEDFGGVKAVGIAAIEGVTASVGFLSNAFRGIEIALLSLEIGFDTLKTGVLGIGAIFSDEMQKAADAAVAEMASSIEELSALMMEPLPSEAIEAFIASFTDPLIIEAKQAQVDEMKAIDAQAGMDRIAKEEEIQSAMAQIQQHWGKQQTSAVRQMFSDLTTLSQTGNKSLFEIGKAAARANVVLSTYEGAQKAYTALAGIPIIGPALGIAAAGAAIAAGGVRLSAINSTSIGGGGGISAGAGGGGGVDTSAATAAEPEQSRTVRISGLDANSTYSGTQVTDMAQQLVELQKDGFKLVI